MDDTKAKTARERAHERQAGRVESRSQGHVPVETYECIHRSVVPVGKLQCSCSNSPEVFACGEPWTVSGYATPFDRSNGKFPPDGQIVMLDGTRASPNDNRRKDYVAWPLRSGEQPNAWEVIVCSTCPKRVQPSEREIAIRRLRVQGDIEMEIGETDVLHLFPSVVRPEDWFPVAGLRNAWICNCRSLSMASIAPYLECKLIMVYGAAAVLKTAVDAIACRPGLIVWAVQQDERLRKEPIPGVVYGLPDDLAASVKAATRDAHAQAVERILKTG
jgi:hypothetical protein